MEIRAFTPADNEAAVAIWNQVVEDGAAFPQTEPLGLLDGLAFWQSQSRTLVCADEDGRVLGLCIIHPNNVGRCGHIANASYAVSRDARGLGVGEALVRASLKAAKALGFRIMQFNAVVKENHAARKLYEKLGFVTLGEIPEGFQMKDGRLASIYVMYKTL